MRTTALALLAFVSSAVISPIAVVADGGGGDMMGDVSRFSPEASIEVTVDGAETCEYTLTFSYTHDTTLPVPDPAAESCDLAGMENYWDFGDSREEINKYTPFDHVSLDWNACGHVPPGVWDKSHYDLHIYLKPFDKEKRSHLLCETDPFDPITCLPAQNQTTPEALGFYDVTTNEQDKIINTPDIDPPYFWIPDSGVVTSGTHIIDTRDLGPASEWKQPTLVMGYYGGAMAFWEPMYPITSDAVSHEVSDIKYVDQTIMSLPTYYSYNYDPATGQVVQVMKGPAEACPKSAEDENDTSPAADGVTSRLALGAIVASVWLGVA